MVFNDTVKFPAGLIDCLLCVKHCAWSGEVKRWMNDSPSLQGIHGLMEVISMSIIYYEMESYVSIIKLCR